MMQINESRTRRRIRKALAEYGFEAQIIRWEHIGKGAEMCGPSGGWEIECAGGIYIIGLNVEQVIEDAKITRQLRGAKHSPGPTQ